MNTTLINSRSDTMYVKDWRKALRSPPTYRLGNRTFRFHYHIALMILFVGSLLLVFLYVKPSSRTYSSNWLAQSSNADNYNYTYPLTPPIVASGLRTYRIGMIADLDTESKSKTDPNIWKSYYKKGYLTHNPLKNTITVSWDDGEPIEFTSSYALKDRGMELSEIVTFNGKLLTFDDRTGIIYEILRDKVIPWLLLTDGDGLTNKGFKSEWATVKDKSLFVGSMGKEWTSSQGDFENENPMYVKEITPNGEVKHRNWSNNFKAIREVLGIQWPGYMIHESGAWSSERRRWYFLPRRCSKEKYNETRDEQMGCNILIEADDGFAHIKSIKIGENIPTHGFSSFKFIPGTNDNVIVALKTEEFNGKTSTYMMAFTVDGEILMKEERIPTNLKYEGFEFV